MLAKIALGVLVAVVLLVIVIATRPSTFRVQRSVTIAAPATVVFAQIEDFHRWSAWNPFEKADPSLRRSYEGAPSGVGAAYHYAGNSKVGEGRMTLTELEPDRRVVFEARFIKPMAATNRVEFTLKPVTGGVSVTWAMSGDQNFVGKAFSLFRDRLVGTQFEKGLAELKRLTEEGATRGARYEARVDSASPRST
ncbi:MAG TPA: SRPBCC family protein [Gemmatimonadaceae bacterium]|nr:SRPBCC family protein [Gemmatimonadaceae bacterium]